MHSISADSQAPVHTAESITALPHQVSSAGGANYKTATTSRVIATVNQELQGNMKSTPMYTHLHHTEDLEQRLEEDSHYSTQRRQSFSGTIAALCVCVLPYL